MVTRDLLLRMGHKPFEGYLSGKPILRDFVAGNIECNFVIVLSKLLFLSKAQILT